MKTRDLILGFLALAAAVALGWWALRQGPQTPPPPVSFEAPAAASGGSPGDCYFNWATRPLDDLSTQAQTALQEVQPGAEARAEAYGEDCIYADGHADFHAMETDFYVSLQVTDVNDPAELGGLIRRSMDLFASRFPTGQTPGPQPGRVNFRFLSPNAEKNLPVQVSAYQNLPSGLSDAEVYQTLFPNPSKAFRGLTVGAIHESPLQYYLFLLTLLPPCYILCLVFTKHSI